ncbi:hypothetical protein [Mycoplasma phocoeninasale]|uniref:DUF4064 domain-containing protein n=1 Tax=Mycoplasma phocoeninasale TaxID=2726117 RepID=A0A858U2S9_9MOLU|nr:hypothetical protein [Mycoplasma phocoeninasale]MBN0970529.1 hypothetical protein [Mycoplasma phocoeninasale]QJG66349.1 hypothetical protein HGG64_01320 [Mycoplasma phocoeninasale]
MNKSTKKAILAFNVLAIIAWPILIGLIIYTYIAAAGQTNNNPTQEEAIKAVAAVSGPLIFGFILLSAINFIAFILNIVGIFLGFKEDKTGAGVLFILSIFLVGLMGLLGTIGSAILLKDAPKQSMQNSSGSSSKNMQNRI